MENDTRANKTNTEAKINTSALKNPRFYLSLIVAISIIVIAYNYTKNPETGKVKEPQEKLPQDKERAEVSTDDDAILGHPNAPVTIIEFSDYECPFCSRFYQETMQKIKSEYIDTKKAKLVFRDFPLSSHKKAQKAAEAAECAGEQDEYYKMHDKIFENQKEIDKIDLKEYAKEIGLNTKEFNECLDSGKMAQEVEKDFKDGQKAGVRATPTFFINNKPLAGAKQFEEFKQVIEEEL